MSKYSQISDTSESKQTKQWDERCDTQEMQLQNDKESVISDSYGESYDQSPDAHDYYGRWEANKRN